jgi:hypothetical protein
MAADGQHVHLPVRGACVMCDNFIQRMPTTRRC